MRILISGYYGFGNVGDEAVLKAILEGLRERAPDIGLTVLSAKPELTTELNDVRSVHRYDWFRIFSELEESGIFLSGGGSLFQDATSRLSFWYYIGLVGLALLFGKKVMIFAQGFGPLRSPFNRLIAKLILDRVDVITLRDEDSFIELKRLGVKKPAVYVTADPTFCLKHMERNEGRKILSLEGVPTGKPLVGIAIRSLSPVPNNGQPLAKFLAEALDRLKEKYDWEPVFLLFQCPEDMGEASRVVNLMKARSHIVFKICRPEEMLALFSCFEFVISMRLHSLIFAALNDVPMVALAYDPKVESFARLAGQPYLEMDELSKLNETLEKALAERTTSAKRLSGIKEDSTNKAKQNFDLFFEYFGKAN